MQSVSNTYKSIVAGSHYFETKVVIGNEDYGEDRIISLSTTNALFDKVGVGNTVASEIDLVIKDWNEIPRMSSLRPYIRAISLTDPTQISEWIPKGVYFIDTREIETDGMDNSLTMTIHGFDAILKMEQDMIPVESESGTWPRTAPVVMQEIATAMGVEIDSRTYLNPAIVAEYPDTGTTMRQVAGYIAGMHAGNWIMTDEGKLRLVVLTPTVESGQEYNLAYDVESLKVSPRFDNWTSVVYFYGSEDTFGAGTEDGRMLEIECPWGDQSSADYTLSVINGKSYQPFTATNALIDPAVELGDVLIIGAYTSFIAKLTNTFDALYSSDVEAPYDEEIEHEYPYSSPASSELVREINKTKAAITVGLDEIRAEVVAGDESVRSEIVQKMDSISLHVETSQGGDNRYATITLRVGEDMYRGQILLDGNVNVSGELSAEALYAAMGDIADLTVDRLSTSRRIVKYLAGDKSDDNFIKIENEEIVFYSGIYHGTGIVEDGQIVSQTDYEQAVNPFGSPIYWESDPAEGEIGTDGYPYKDGVRIFTTTEQTDWPVYVYTYYDTPKASFKFEQVDDVYVPVLTFGAGNEQGNNIAQIAKDANTASFLYTDPSGSKIGIVMNANGFTDIYGLRKTVTMDFSEWSSGHFTETVDGGIQISYSVEFDSAGRPVSISDGSHTTTVVW